jgi:hypothetical protein
VLDKNQATIITAICLVGGAVIGYLIGDASFGLIVGFLISLGITGSYRRVSLTKANRRIIVGVVFTAMILVGIWFGLYTGDYLSGLGSAMALSFVIVLKMEKLYDERVGVLFNKASRDGFITANLVLALFLFTNRIYGGSQTLSFLTFNNILLTTLGLCWIVFLASLLYHAYIKGE